MARRASAHHSILVYHSSDAKEYAALVRAPRGVTVHTAASVEAARALIADVDVIYTWKMPAELYPAATRLRWLQAMGAGIDWVPDAALAPDVTITRAPGIFGPWMAEYVAGWCLWVTQRMAAYREAQAERRWIAHELPTRLRGRTVLLVGVGDIGRVVARTLTALGARVEGVNTTGRPVPGVHRMHSTRRLLSALPAADFVVVLVPLAAATRGLIGARALAAMKRTAWLMNIARGAVVDEPALVRALESNAIAGAVLDVFTTEPLPSDHPLWKLPNVVVTPHISGPSTVEEIAPVFNDNLRRYVAGRPLRHRIDRRKGY
jgi:glyoxylate/hydroxypyruvate reductase A